MRIRKPGKVCDHIWFLGDEESCVYLVEGRDESMFIGGAMGYIVPEVMKQLDEFHIDKGRIKKLLILHAHFDHVGIVPFMKRSLPDLQVYASARGWEILQTPKAIKTFNEFSRMTTERIGKTEICSEYDLDWREDVTGTRVTDGDDLDLGEMHVHILETPGHSSCSVSAYIPQLKALFPSDGGGIPYKDIIIPSGNSNYTQCQQSLEKLKGLEVRYLCADHFGYVTGEEALNFISRSIQASKEFRTGVEEDYSRTRDVNTLAREITETFYAENPDYFLSPEIFEGVYRQVIKHIAGAVEGEA